MTRKKRHPVKSIEKLSNDIKGQRALKGSGQRLLVSVSTIDRWIQKAEALERLVKYLKVPKEVAE